MRRFLILFLAMALLATTAGCSMASDPEPGSSQLGAYSDHGTVTETAPKREHISLVFYEDMDCNPLTATNSENHELLKLVYSPLIRLDGNLKPQYVLAEAVQAEGTDVTVTLKAGLKFSDGTPVTAADVEESIKVIRANPTSPYYARLENIKKYRATDERTVQITLHQPDVDFINCLDLPVVQKKGGLGCGPYRFSQKGGEQVLTPNKHYFAQPVIKTVYLKKPTGEKQRQEMFSVGLLDVYFGTAERSQVFAGGKDYAVQTYPGDNLLYLGVNCREGLLADPAFRYFLNQLTVREKLVNSVLLGQAEAARYPYQPSWYKAEQTVSGRGLSNEEKKARAAKLGLQVTEKALLDGEGKPLSFELLVTEESVIHTAAAEAIAEGLAVAGVEISVKAVPRATYDARLAEGKYQLYLGEVKTGRTLNPNLYTAGSLINFSGALFPELEQAAANYKNGELLLTDYCKVFDQYTPILPLAYRGGGLFTAADIGEFKFPATWALYGDITKLVIKTDHKETENTK